MSLRTLPSRLQSLIPTPKSRAILPPVFQSYQFIRPYVSGGPSSNPSSQKLKVWPFVFILCGGSGAYVLMVRARANAESPKPRNQQRR
ncbi:MAG: hypothetical protein LQ338_002856 [Usnochroma carphineum]|nr:MAG: hypothetical protein LQ338_002856 [Usnochroma carphineum]